MLILKMADATLMAVVVDPVEHSHLRLIASPGLLVCEIDAVAPLRPAFFVDREAVVDGEARRLLLVVL
jgi:hypothetical protein